MEIKRPSFENESKAIEKAKVSKLTNDRISPTFTLQKNSSKRVLGRISKRAD